MEHTPLTIPEALERAEQVAARCAARADALDREGAFPADEFCWLAQAGLLAAVLPPGLGGAGLGSLPGTTPDLLRLLRHIGRGSLPVGRIYEGHVNALLLVQRYGAPSQQARWAADARDAHRLFSVWSTQGADGVRFLPLPGGRWRIEGAKTFASGGTHIARPLVTGALPDGTWQMAILPTERLAPAAFDPSFWQPLGMKGTVSGHMDFTGLEIGPEDFLGAPGDYFRQPWFSGGGVRFMAVQLGGAQALLDAVRAFVHAQGRGGDPFVRERVGRMAALVETGALWLRGAGERMDCVGMDCVGMDCVGMDCVGMESRAAVEYTHLARAVIEDACLDVLRLADRTAGARGLLRPHPFERLHRDLTLYLRQGGADAALPEAGAFVLESDLPTDALWNPVREH